MGFFLDRLQKDSNRPMQGGPVGATAWLSCSQGCCGGGGGAPAGGMGSARPGGLREREVELRGRGSGNVAPSRALADKEPPTCTAVTKASNSHTHLRI